MASRGRRGIATLVNHCHISNNAIPNGLKKKEFKGTKNEKIIELLELKMKKKLIYEN